MLTRRLTVTGCLIALVAVISDGLHVPTLPTQRSLFIIRQALPSEPLSNAEIARYSRHLVLGDVGVVGQQKIKDSSVLVIGAGGLGSPALLYLAAAGVGHLGIVDGDTVGK